MPEDRSFAALFRVELDSAGRLVGTVRYLAPLSGTQAQQLCPLAGRDAFVAAMAELLDTVAGAALRGGSDDGGSAPVGTAS